MSTCAQRQRCAVRHCLIYANIYREGAKFLDLFAGSGAMGIEALSRGAAGATFVDSHANCIKCIKTNVEKLGLTMSVKIIHRDVFVAMRSLAKLGQQFDIIYADPPYHDLRDKNVSFSARVVMVYEELAKSGSQLLTPQGELFIEDAIELDKNLPLAFLRRQNVRHLGKSVLHQYHNAVEERQ